MKEKLLYLQKLQNDRKKDEQIKNEITSQIVQQMNKN